MSALLPYVPRLLATWPEDLPAPSFQELEGSMAFVDVSGFTKMSERLARHGKVGAEEVTDVIGSCFTALLGVAYAEEGGLLKFGGDALLLFFSDDDHRARAARAASRMRRTLREIGRIPTSAGAVTLRMSVGVHSGTFHFFLVGSSHHELIVAGPAATRTVEMESLADAGEILLSPEAADGLPARNRGAAKGEGILLAGTPPGASLAAAPSSPLGARGVARHLPSAIRMHLEAGGVEPEHRLVTIAFVHVGGVDAPMAAVGPAPVCDALHALVARAQQAADEHRVTFLGSDIAADGTKIILVAGAPSALGDDEERLLRAARAISDADAEPLQVRIGINRGHVFAGDIGPAYRRTYTVMGDAVNLAARLMQHAAGGEILATIEVLEHARSEFEREAIAPFGVKGKDAPVHAFRVGPATGGRRVAVDRSPLVGREAELDTLLGALADARAGTGRIVEIVGEPGLGKSRLLAELVSHADGLPHISLACEPYAASTPYHPFRAALRRALEIGETDDDQDAAARLRSAVSDSAPGLLPWLPLLATTVGLEIERTPETTALDARFRRPRLHATLPELLAALHPGPVLCTVEDAHWMDDASADLLAHLAGHPDLPWLVCATRRDGPTALHLADAETIALAPLPQEQSAALLAAATEEAPLHPHEVEALTRRAGGNPLFLRELLAARQDAAAAAPGGAAGAGADALPQSVEAAIAVRIDQLPPPERAALRRLSVLGPLFDRGLVEAVLPEPDAVGRLDAFLEPAGPEALRFRHALIRDAAYEGLPFKLRQELHELVAVRIERQAFPDVDAHAEVLALHFSEAGSHGSAWIYARVAARRAQTIYANVEAASFYERALAAARRLDTVTKEATAELWEALGDIHQRMGEFGKATKAYRTARRVLGDDAVGEARLLLKEAWVARRAGRFADALRWISRGHAALQGANDEGAARERARLSSWYASIRQEQGRSAEAVRWAHRAIEEAEASGARDALAHASYILDWAHVLQGRLDLATNSERALAIYEELGDLAGQANVLNNLGGFAYERGRWDEAIAYYERGREARERTGDAVNAAFGTINVAEILADQGRLEEAEVRIRDGLRVWRAAGDRAGTAFALTLLGRVAARAGRSEEALRLLDEARREFAFVGAAADVVGVDARIAESALLAGDADGARTLAEQALERSGAVERAAVFRPLLHRVIGHALLLRGDRAAAAAAFESSLAEARAREAGYEVALTLRGLAEASRTSGDEARARSLEGESGAILERLGVVSVPRIPLAV